MRNTLACLCLLSFAVTIIVADDLIKAEFQQLARQIQREEGEDEVDPIRDAFITEQIEKRRQEILKRNNEPDLLMLFLNDPLAAVNYARANEAKARNDAFKTSGKRRRRSLKENDNDLQYTLNPNDVYYRQNDGFIIELLPKDLKNVILKSWIHFRVCAKPMIPKEVTTNRKLEMPYKDCASIEKGGIKMLDPKNLIVPWLYRTFFDDEFVHVQIGSAISFKYWPLRRQLENVSPVKIASYTHATNRSTIISVHMETATLNQNVTVKIENPSKIGSPFIKHKVIESQSSRNRVPRSPGIKSNRKLDFYTLGEASIQKAVAASFDFKILEKPEVYELDMKTNASTLNRLIFDPDAMMAKRGEFRVDNQNVWKAATTETTLPFCINGTDDDNLLCFKPSTVVDRIQGSNRKGAQDSIDIQKKKGVENYEHREIANQGEISVLEVDDVISIACDSYTPNVSLRIWQDEAKFTILRQLHTRESEILRHAQDRIVLKAIAPSMKWKINSFLHLDGSLFLYNRSQLTPVSCGDFSKRARMGETILEPKTMHFVILTKEDFQHFCHWRMSQIESTKGIGEKDNLTDPVPSLAQQIIDKMTVDDESKFNSLLMCIFFLSPFVLIGAVIVLIQMKMRCTKEYADGRQVVHRLILRAQVQRKQRAGKVTRLIDHGSNVSSC